MSEDRDAGAAPRHAELEARGVDIVCPECGERVHVADVVGLVRTLHSMNDCAELLPLLAPKVDE